MPGALRVELAPLVAVLESPPSEVNAAADPVIRRLIMVPGVGPVTAATFVADLDD
jgi:hypothetical protein